MIRCLGDKRPCSCSCVRVCVRDVIATAYGGTWSDLKRVIACGCCGAFLKLPALFLYIRCRADAAVTLVVPRCWPSGLLC